mgnify:CR=1 FL=1
MDCAAFCCSFQEKEAGKTMSGAFAQTFSQDSHVMQVEESAFDLDDMEDHKMDSSDDIAQIQAEEVQKTRAEMVAEREALKAKFGALNIDSSAVKFYFKSLRNSTGSEDSFLESISLMVEIILTENEQNSEDPLKQLMCIRGLLMLALNERIALDRGQEIASRILATVNKIMQKPTATDKRTVAFLSQHALVIQYLAVMPYKV